MRPIIFKTSGESSMPIPLTFIDRYMPACTPVYALIYIFGLRQSMSGEPGMSTQEIGEIFHILETDVLNAWKYWESQGLIIMDTQDGALSIEFLTISEETQANLEISTKSMSTANMGQASIGQKIDLRSQYTTEELSFYQKQSMDIAKLFSHGEQTLGKMLTYHDLNVLFGFYDWLRLPIDVILHLLTYCSEGGHRDLRYVEKVAIDWAERNIITVEAATNYTQTFDRDYKAIMKALGHPSSFPSHTQRKYMNKWLDELGMTVELIVEACDKTAVQIGKPKLTYVDKIIADWSKRGIKTLDEVAEAEHEWKKAEKAEREERNKHTVQDEKPVIRRNRFANFKPRERDYEQIERLEQEYLIRSVEG